MSQHGIDNVTKEIAAIQLGPKEQALVEAYVETGDWVRSADLSGYSHSEHKSVAKLASRSPAILAAVHVAVARRLVEGAAVGLKVLLDIARGDATSAQDRKLQLDAAKELLKLGGHVGPRSKAAESDAGRQLHEMSLDDLRRQRDALERELADRSRPIAPGEAPADSHDVDLLG